MDKFIQLTLPNEDPLLVNISKIDYVTRQEKLHKGAIVMIGDYPAKVKESYETVMGLIKYCA